MGHKTREKIRFYYSSIYELETQFLLQKFTFSTSCDQPYLVLLVTTVKQRGSLPTKITVKSRPESEKATRGIGGTVKN